MDHGEQMINAGKTTVATKALRVEQETTKMKMLRFGLGQTKIIKNKISYINTCTQVIFFIVVKNCN
jgi:hypothetical protein